MHTKADAGVEGMALLVMCLSCKHENCAQVPYSSVHLKSQHWGIETREPLKLAGS